MSKGIYCYVDNETGLIDYIGKDSYIDKNGRHNDHKSPSKYNEQKFNQVLQNNPTRWEYQRLYECDIVDDETLNQLEITFIERYNPRFNFTKGGEGMTGYKHSDETKQKLRENHADFSRENNPSWKDYHRIIKEGFDNGKQRYSIRYEGKVLKKSVYIHKLYKWFGKNYPNQYLYFEVK